MKSVQRQPCSLPKHCDHKAPPTGVPHQANNLTDCPDTYHLIGSALFVYFIALPEKLINDRTQGLLHPLRQRHVLHRLGLHRLLLSHKSCLLPLEDYLLLSILWVRRLLHDQCPGPLETLRLELL